MSIDSPETDLWVAVISQALSDATLGLGIFRTPKRRAKAISCNLPMGAVYDGRRFIKGRDGSLKAICDLINLDFEETQQKLASIYEECLPEMPEEWRQSL